MKDFFYKLFLYLRKVRLLTTSYSLGVFLDPLSDEEESFYIKKLFDGDKGARNKLIEHNLRLVAHLVKKYESKDISSDDLISIGTIGLIKGVDSYDKDKNIKLTTYIAKCALNEILMYFRSNKKFNNEISLNDYISIDKEGNEISLIDILPSDEEDIDSKIHKDISIELLHEYLGCLTNKEKDIIIKRYGLYGGDYYTQKEIAKMMKISRSYVSRMEKRALIKLYKEFYKNKKGL